MDAHCQKIFNEYVAKKPIYEKLCEVVTSNLKKSLSNGRLIAGIEARLKTENSLKGKLELKGMKYSSLSDITDILGARVITFYTDDIEPVAAVIETIFDVDWENSVDKRKIHESNSFGYMSLHYICRLPERIFKDENYPEINDIRFEIQMRTALQHVWATIEHDMGYKTDVEIPIEYSRALSRLAGLLEIADEEFRTVREKIFDYRRKVLKLVKSGNFDDVSFSVDSFKNYLEVEPFKPITESIASALHTEVQPAGLLPYYSVFKTLGVKTLGDIEKIKKECTDDAVRLVVYQIGDKDI
ncbi:MAG: (p)ppGpp synthetase, partial [Clostridia bacterium]|nr:(p)ppGpp synthetase [Clostridia bacterium]